MGKVVFIKKSRKEYKCGKCGSVIPAGSPYYKGELFRMRPMVRCTSCKLKHYEVTTSDYITAVGKIVEEWQEYYGIGEDTIGEIVDALYEIHNTCEENYDNIPDQLQEGAAAMLLQERMEELDGAISDLESIDDWDDFLLKGRDALDEDVQGIIDKEQEKRNGEDYNIWFDEFVGLGSDAASHWKEAVYEEFVFAVDEILGQLTY